MSPETLISQVKQNRIISITDICFISFKTNRYAFNSCINRKNKKLHQINYSKPFKCYGLLSKIQLKLLG